MNHLYPVFMKLKGKKCTVIGGGKVAVRKVKTLLDSEARVTVIGTKLIKDLKSLAENGLIQAVEREYKEGDLDDSFLTIAATGSRELNNRISREARSKKIPCNIVDNPRASDFFIPAVYTKGNLKIAISTNGKSPALARKIKEELPLFYGKEVASFLNTLGSLRKKLKEKVPDEKKRSEILLKIIKPLTIHTLKEKSREEAEKIRKEIERWI